MWLENLKVRTRYCKKGWVVEIELTKRYLFFWRIKYWTHLISVSGISNKPWYYQTQEMAISEAKKYFEWDILINSNEI